MCFLGDCLSVSFSYFPFALFHFVSFLISLCVSLSLSLYLSSCTCIAVLFFLSLLVPFLQPSISPSLVLSPFLHRYTSLGTIHDTIPNPLLKREDGTYMPAWELKDTSQERAGRGKDIAITKETKEEL